MAGPFARRACMTVQREHVESAKWCDEVAPLFGIAIINAGTFTSTSVNHLRSVLAEPKIVLAYENLRDATSFVFGTGYDIRRRSILEPGLVPGWHSYVLPDGTRVPGFVLRPQIAEPLADMVARRCKELGTNGLYVDQGNPRYPDQIRNQITAASTVAFSRIASEDYVEGRLLFTRALAQKIIGPYGGQGSIIVNCRTETFDPELTGVSLEGVTDPISGLRALLRVPNGRSIVWDNSGEAALSILGALDFVWIGSQLAGIEETPAGGK